MGKPTVYVETSVFSYLTARRSRNSAAALRQDITREWWDTKRNEFRLVISDAVYREAERGDRLAAAKRLRLVETVERLVVPAEPVKELTKRLISGGSLPFKAIDDAGHVASAAVAGVDYLCSWNFRHLLNPVIRRRAEEICQEYGYRAATVCTPEELLFT